MTTVGIPVTGSLLEPRPSADSVPAKVAVVVLGALSALGLAYVGTSLTMAAVVIVLIVGGAGAYVMFTQVQLLIRIAVYSIWVEALAFGPISVGRLVSALIVFVVAARILTSQWRIPAIEPRAWLATAALMIWAAVGGFYSQSFFGGWLVGFLILCLGFAYFVVFLLFVESPQQLAELLTGWVWIGTGLALLSDFAHFVIGNARTSGLTGNPNLYSILLITGLPIIVVLARNLSGRARRLMLLNIPIYLSAVIGTGSRMGLIMGFVMGAYMFATWPGLSPARRVGNMAVGAVSMMVVGLVFLLLNPERFSPAALVSDRGAGRLDFLNAGLTMVQDHLLVGRALGGFRLDIFSVLQRTNNADLSILRGNDVLVGAAESHNLYLTILIDLGLIGFVFYFGVFAAAFKNLWDQRKSQWRWWVWAFSGVLLALLVASFFGSQLNNKVQWAVAGIAASFYVRPRMTAPVDSSARQLGGHNNNGMSSQDGSGSGVGTAVALAQLNDTSGRDRSNYGPARLDLRMRWPLRRLVGLAALGGALLGGSGTYLLKPPTYTGTVMVLGLTLDNPNPARGVGINDPRLQSIASLARSEPFLVEMARRAGVKSRSIDELHAMVTADRPTLSAVIRIQISDRDPEIVSALSDEAVTALGVVIDRSRDGALGVLNEERRDPSADQARSYRGPIYLDTFQGRAEIGENSPSLINATFTGALLGALVMLFAAMLAAARPRVTTDENLGQLLGTPQLGRLPRVGRRSGNVLHQAQGIASGLDLLGDDVRTAAFVGNGIRRERALWTLVGACATSTSYGRPVIVVDLDLRHRDLSKRCGVNGHRWFRSAPAAGVVEALADHRAGPPMLQAVSRRRLPRVLRPLMGQGSSVLVLGAGRVLGDDLIDEEAIPELVQQLSAIGTVFLHLPEPSGIIGFQQPIGAADAVVQVLLDGWTPLDQAMATSSMISVMGVPTGYILLDNS